MEIVDHSQCQEMVKSLRLEITALEQRCETTEEKVKRMVAWLEENQPDVFSRGIWDAIEK